MNDAEFLAYAWERVAHALAKAEDEAIMVEEGKTMRKFMVELAYGDCVGVEAERVRGEDAVCFYNGRAGHGEEYYLVATFAPGYWRFFYEIDSWGNGHHIRTCLSTIYRQEDND